MRGQFSAKHLIASSLILGASLLPTAAHAGELWMILGDGNKLEAGVAPNRVMHFAYAGQIRDLTDQNAKIAEITRDPNPKTIDARLKALEVKEMNVVEIYEHPSAPGFKMLTMQFQCMKKLYRVAKAEAKERNSLHRFSGATEWRQYVPSDWQSRAYFVACGKEIWEPMAQAEIKQMQQTNTVTKQSSLRDYGVGIIGAWSKNKGLNQVYRLTWDKIWAGKATPVPFHHNRNAAEEAEYQAWKKGNDAIIAQNEKDAPAVLASIDDLQGKVTGELKALDAERAFMKKVAANFAKKKQDARERFFSLQGWTEQEIVDFWGVPNNVKDHLGTRALDYKSRVDTRRTEQVTTPVLDGKGQVIGSTSESREAGALSECDLTLFLEPGGSKPGYRLVDYRLNGTGCTWDTLGRLRR